MGKTLGNPRTQFSPSNSLNSCDKLLGAITRLGTAYSPMKPTIPKTRHRAQSHQNQPKLPPPPIPPPKFSLVGFGGSGVWGGDPTKASARHGARSQIPRIERDVVLGTRAMRYGQRWRWGLWRWRTTHRGRRRRRLAGTAPATRSKGRATAPEACEKEQRGAIQRASARDGGLSHAEGAGEGFGGFVRPPARRVRVSVGEGGGCAPDGVVRSRPWRRRIRVVALARALRRSLMEGANREGIVHHQKEKHITQFTPPAPAPLARRNSVLGLCLRRAH